jgi:RNA-directed DNA polymerase
VASVGDPESRAPAWLLRPLPVNAVLEQSLLDEIDRLAAQLPKSLWKLSSILQRVEISRSYDAAVNRACTHVWNSLPEILRASSAEREALGSFALQHFVPAARYRVLRRLAKDADTRVRRNSKYAVEKGRVHEIALPLDPAGAAPGERDWSANGWFAGLQTHQLFRRREVPPALEATLPPIADIAELRKLFDIRSGRRLGWLLVASDDATGPYVSFNILKQSGLPRSICSPRWPLKRVQRRILREILERVPVHPAAHGFVKGRSTVTNALPHCGARLVIKFDLQDFFPTIHYFRVVGLFASLGYGIATARFSTADRSRDVAAALARLCTYTPEPRKFGSGHLPQGAPTSPAISNLICRGLDSRLAGLAQCLHGMYTRYADDLTFSFREADFELGRFRWWVDQICHQEGFFVNQAKFRVIRASQRQCVTGIVVNDSLRVPREERRRFRAILHNCRRNGIAAEARGDLGFRGYLQGFASYLAMVHPKEGRPLLQEVHELLRGDSPP